MNQNKNKKYDLEERTYIFAENIINICQKSIKNVITIPIISQVVRSGTSIGANYGGANGASSKKDFRNKIFTCKKESKETQYWLKLLACANSEIKEECQMLGNEAHEFVLIFSKIANNSK